MRIFVTGGTGFVGRAVIQEPLANGYQILAIARNEDGVKALRAAGAEAFIGSLEDTDSLVRGAQDADGIIHLAFIHDFSKFEHSVVVDKNAIETMSKAIAGTKKPLIITSGTLALKKGVLGTEHSALETEGLYSHRSKSAELLFEASKSLGFRGMEVRLSPVTHDVGDWGFVPILIDFAKKNGFVGYLGEGNSVWPAVHRLDAAVLYRLALENGRDGTSYHAVAEQGIKSKDIMTAIAEKLNLPVKSMSQEQMDNTLGFFAHPVGADNPTSSEWTQKQLGWKPHGIGLLEDIEKNYSV